MKVFFGTLLLCVIFVSAVSDTTKSIIDDDDSDLTDFLIGFAIGMCSENDACMEVLKPLVILAASIILVMLIYICVTDYNKGCVTLSFWDFIPSIYTVFGIVEGGIIGGIVFN